MTLAISFAAQNAVTALPLQAVPPLLAASRRSQRPTALWRCRPVALLTIASTPVGSNAGKHAA